MAQVELAVNIHGVEIVCSNRYNIFSLQNHHRGIDVNYELHCEEDEK